jgi:hypothetical protein
MRLRFRQQRGDVAFFSRLAARLAAFPTVRSVHSSPLTGSVLIFHSGKGDEIARHAGAAKPSDGVGVNEGNRAFERQIPHPKTLAFCGLALLQLARGRLANSTSQHFWDASAAAGLGHTPFAITMAGLGLFQFFKGRVLAPASSFLMFALMTEASRKQPQKESSGRPATRLASARNFSV